MKEFFIEKIVTNRLKYLDKELELLGWIGEKRVHKNICFFDLVDSTGTIQVVFEHTNNNDIWKMITAIREETAVKITGILKNTDNKIEIRGNNIKIIGDVNIDLSPHARSNFKIFDSKYQNHVLNNRSFYLRNPKQAAVLSFKSKFIFELHRYFQEKNYTLIDAPVLTEMLLYEDKSAFSFEYNGNRVWLSQCCTFQLEAAISAFEKVYNITPSFRAEHSRSDRHLGEYTHLKIELAWADLEDLIDILGNIIFDMGSKMKQVAKKELEILESEIDTGSLQPPFTKVSYTEAIDILNKNGYSLEWGRSLSVKDEEFLTEYYGNKFIWVQFVPCSAEGFPFKHHLKDHRLTMTSDLIAPFGFGEIGGTAEKITDKEELLERMKEKGRNTKKDLIRYQSYIKLRDYGMVPHGGIGVGIERLVRYYLKLSHVKDTISYPRLYRRRWNP